MKTKTDASQEGQTPDAARPQTDAARPQTDAVALRARAGAAPGPRRAALWVMTVIAIAVALLDQGSKAWAVDQLGGGHARFPWPGRLHLAVSLNPGSAFGMIGSEGDARVGLTLLALTISAGVVLALALHPPRSAWPRVAAGLAIGGALSNAADRWFRAQTRRIYRDTELAFSDLLEHGDALHEAARSGRHWVEWESYGVVDFIIVYLTPERAWPAFNLADVALSSAALCVLIWTWRETAPKAEDEQSAPDALSPAAGDADLQ